MVMGWGHVPGMRRPPLDAQHAPHWIPQTQSLVSAGVSRPKGGQMRLAILLVVACCAWSQEPAPADERPSREDLMLAAMAKWSTDHPDIPWLPGLDLADFVAVDLFPAELVGKWGNDDMEVT